MVKKSNTFKVLGLDNTYSISVSDTALSNVTASYGASGTLSGSFRAIMSPAWGLSSVDITGVTLSAGNSNFNDVSVNVSLPITLLNNEVVSFNAVYINPAHTENILVPYLTEVATSNASMSAGATGGALSGVQTFYSSVYTLTAAGITTTYLASISDGPLAESVAYGAAYTILDSASITVSPIGGLTSVDVTAITISAGDSKFSAVSTNITLPATIANGGEIVFCTIYTNSPHTYTASVPFNVRLVTDNEALSAGIAGASSLTGPQSWSSGVRSISALGITTTYRANVSSSPLTTSIAYGTSGTIYSNAAAEMIPVGGLSSVEITGFTVSAGDSNFGAVSANTTLPAKLTHGQAVNFSVVYNNTNLHANNISVPVMINTSTANAAMSAGITGGSSLSGVNMFLGEVGIVTALGDAGAPSGISSFTATPVHEGTNLTWVRSAMPDVVGTIITRSLTLVPATTAQGTLVYQGTAAAFNDTGLDANHLYNYSAFAYDNVGKISSAVSLCSQPMWYKYSSHGEFIRLYEVEGCI